MSASWYKPPGLAAAEAATTGDRMATYRAYNIVTLKLILRIL
jgi:hypothetical protein